jgi:hypothetical protein
LGGTEEKLADIGPRVNGVAPVGHLKEEGASVG